MVGGLFNFFVYLLRVLLVCLVTVVLMFIPLVDVLLRGRIHIDSEQIPLHLIFVSPVRTWHGIPTFFHLARFFIAKTNGFIHKSRILRPF
jgi:hypothetical protein